MQVGRHLIQSEALQPDPMRMGVMIDLGRERAFVVRSSLPQSETDQCVASGGGTLSTRVQTSLFLI